MNKARWTTKEGSIEEWDLKCDVLSIHIVGIGYRRANATWMVWIGSDNMAALMGTSETMRQAKDDALAATRDLMGKVKDALDAPFVIAAKR